MLSELNIQNIAVIESADLSFENGFNVLSGETGAGKSIIIDALSAVLGERTSRELIRTGADHASVSAVFTDLPPEVDGLLAEMGLPPLEGGELAVSRTLYAEGRNNCRLNGAPVSVAMLKRLGTLLISIHGQHDSQALLDPETHFRFLDEMGDHDELLATYREHYEEFVKLYRKYKQLSTDEESLLRRIDFLKFEIAEIEAADIRVGEYDELLDRRTFFRDSEKILKGLNSALQALKDGEESNGAVSLAFDALSDLKVPAMHLDEVETARAQLTDAAFALQSVRDTLDNVLYTAQYDPAEQDRVEDRIAQLNKLRSRFGATEEEILQKLEDEREELRNIEVSDADRKELEAVLEQKKTVLLSDAVALTNARRETARVFEQAVKQELEFLNMPHVELGTSFDRCKLNPNGADVIEFLISPNPGEDLKPLSKIASGGELARIMLAIQNVLSKGGNVGTMIFDEIDTGVSGSAAERIARKLQEVSRDRQVLCITHSPQVAAYADAHYLIEKNVEGGKTYTRVTPLDRTGREAEIARIIGGEQVSELQLRNAAEMLDFAARNQ